MIVQLLPFCKYKVQVYDQKYGVITAGEDYTDASGRLSLEIEGKIIVNAVQIGEPDYESLPKWETRVIEDAKGRLHYHLVIKKEEK
jgi:hypothetical protein